MIIREYQIQLWLLNPGNTIPIRLLRLQGSISLFKNDSDLKKDLNKR